MRLFTRLALLMVALILLPAVPAAWMTRGIVTRTLDLGLSPKIDAGLKSGVNQGAGQYQRLGRDLADSLGAWIAEVEVRMGPADGGARARARAEDVLRAVAGPLGPRLPGSQAVLKLPDGTERVLRSAAPDTSAVGVPLSGYPPPRTADATQTLADGSVLTIECRTSKEWRDDAYATSNAFQILRGRNYLRKEIERRFWLPFLGLYVASIVAALLVAGWLARGVLVPVQRLVRATQEVGAGNWSVRVPIKGRDEMNRLGAQFNDMIGRLNAQSRRLAELETIAKWQETTKSIVHEVSNPLWLLGLKVAKLQRGYQGDDGAYAASLDRGCRAVLRQVESTNRTVDRFRKFSRPVDAQFAPVDLNAVVADVGSLLSDVSVDLDLDPGVGLISADADRLRQVLINLTSNALAAMTGRASPCIRLATRPAGDGVVVEVEDNGPGIPAEDRERVFEPYRSKTDRGLGLGLTMVKGIVLAHGGSVRVEEGRLGGALLRVDLPRIPEA